MRVRDLIGQKFNNLTVVSRGENSPRGSARWNCVCECGAVVDNVLGSNLTNNHTCSCGCLKIALWVENRTTHGMSGTKEHKAWKAIHARCGNPATRSYPLYGGRGIFVDPRWDNFEQFYADMGRAPSVSHSIERKDNDGPYSPENCVWATKTEQANNRRSNRLVNVGGTVSSLADCCRRLDFPYAVALRRLHFGWSDERTFSEPIKHNKVAISTQTE